MDDKRKYEEIISESIKRAIDDPQCTPDYFQDMMDMDFSFLDNQPKPIDKANSDRKREPRWKKVVIAASILLAIFVCSNLLAIFYAENNTVQAIKTRITEFIWKTNGAEEIIQEGTMNDSTELLLEIEDWKEIGRAKKLLEELYIPRYIPENYEFKNLSITKTKDISYRIVYRYQNLTGDYLTIAQNYVKDVGNVLVSTENIYKKVDCNLGELYLTYDLTIDRIAGAMVKDTDYICVRGTISEDALIAVFDGLSLSR